jgi:hypothetical protein
MGIPKDNTGHGQVKWTDLIECNNGDGGMGHG